MYDNEYNNSYKLLLGKVNYILLLIKFIWKCVSPYVIDYNMNVEAHLSIVPKQPNRELQEQNYCDMQTRQAIVRFGFRYLRFFIFRQGTANKFHKRVRWYVLELWGYNSKFGLWLLFFFELPLMHGPTNPYFMRPLFLT